MNKKKLKVVVTIIAFALCFLFHSVYKKIPCFLTSIFFPVNESIWEHMKILFGSIMLSGVFQKLYLIYKNEDLTNVCFSNFVGALFSIPIFLIIFLPVYSIIGENLPITIIIMLITIVISECISYKIMIKRDFHMEKLTILFVISIYIIFGILTYYPVESSLFLDPKTFIYGINK